MKDGHLCATGVNFSFIRRPNLNFNQQLDTLRCISFACTQGVVGLFVWADQMIAIVLRSLIAHRRLLYLKIQVCVDYEMKRRLSQMRFEVFSHCRWRFRWVVGRESSSFCLLTLLDLLLTLWLFSLFSFLDYFFDSNTEKHLKSFYNHFARFLLAFNHRFDFFHFRNINFLSNDNSRCLKLILFSFHSIVFLLQDGFSEEHRTKIDKRFSRDSFAPNA